MNRIKAFFQKLSDHADLLVVVGGLFLLRWAYTAVQSIDARIGFDGWSDTLYYLLNLSVGVGAIYAAWLIKVRLHGETSTEDDNTLRHRVADTSRGALYVLVLDMVTMAWWTVVMLWIVFGKH